MTELVLGIRLKADGSGLVGEVKVSRAELEKLTQSTRKAGAAGERGGRQMEGLARGTNRAGNMARVLNRRQQSLARGLGATERRARLLRVALIALATGGAARIVKSFLDASRTAEQYRVRLNVLLGDVEEANRLFEDAAKFASRVPFEYQEIMGAATQLSGILRGGREEILEWLPIISDLAATSGLTIEETTGQIIRMLSAGAGAADLFRERGILAMLDFQAGVSVSAEETRKRLIAAWEDPASKFRGASAELAKTWDGLMSMMGDKWFQFRNKIMDAGPFEFLKASLAVINADLDASADEWDAYAERMGDKIVGTAKTIALGAAATIDTLSPIADVALDAAGRLVQAFNNLPGFMQQAGLFGALLFGKRFGLVFFGGMAIADEMARLSKEVLDDMGVSQESLLRDIFVGTLPEAAPRENVSLLGGERGSTESALADFFERVEAMRALMRAESDEGGGARPRATAAAVIDTKALEAAAKANAKAQEEIRRAWLKTLPVFEQARIKAELWRAEAMAGLDRTQVGYEEFAAKVDEVYSDMIAEALEENLRVSREWSDGAQRAFKDYAEGATDAASNVERAVTGTMDHLEDEFARGEISVSSFVTFIEQELRRLFFRQFIGGPTSEILGQILGSVFGGGSGGGSNLADFTNPDIAHAGGVVGRDSLPKRRVPSAAFAGAQRYHLGGVVGRGEVPAILRRGEEVLTESDPRHRDNLTPVVVNVINQAPNTDAQVRERRGPGGQRLIEATIFETVDRGIRGGRLDGALDQRFGAKPVGAR